MIGFINNKNKFFERIKELGKKNASTLGFMPQGAFEDYAKSRCIIIAYDDEKLMGYLMYRIVPRYSRINIVHLCVADDFRGKGVSKQLLDTLKEKYNHRYRGIQISCRKDFAHATAVWERNGFISLKDIRSRSLEEHYLSLWWYDLKQPNLFNSSLPTETKVSALLDANIIIKLRDSQKGITLPPTENPQVLLADWLTNETELCYAPETYNEIQRDKNIQRANSTRTFLDNFRMIEVDEIKMNKTAKELERIISGSSNNDISDRKQIASCIVSGISYFITYDARLLNKREEIEESYDIQIFNPQEFILQIDKLLHKEDYSPRFLKGVAYHTISQSEPKHIQTFINCFWLQKGGESKTEFHTTVYRIINASSGQLFVVNQNGKAIAFYGTNEEQTSIGLEFVRIIETKVFLSLFTQVIYTILQDGLNKGKTEFFVKEKFLTEHQITILENIGFVKQINGIYKKYGDSQLVSRNDIPVLLKTKFNIQYKDIAENVSLFDLEKMLFPLKIQGLDIPIYIIPIQSLWAGQLFDSITASEDIFGAIPEKLWSFENVYFRHTRPITEKAPARILWYVSGNKYNSPRSKSIIATSYLTEVMTGKPKELFRINSRYGIYEWCNIANLCNNDIEKNIRALKFSHTEVFQHPIRFTHIKEIFIEEGQKVNTFASPVLTSESIYFKIYQLGKWGKTR